MSVTVSHVKDAMNAVVDRKNVPGLEVQDAYRGLFRSPEHGHPCSLVGNVLDELGLPLPPWKRNDTLMGEFEFKPYTDAKLSDNAVALLRRAQQLDREGVRWRVIADRLA